MRNERIIAGHQSEALNESELTPRSNGGAGVTAAESKVAVGTELSGRASAGETGTPRTAEPPEVLSVDEAAAFLRVNPKTLREAIARGEVPGVRRIGRVIRLSRAALLEWLRGKPAT